MKTQEIICVGCPMGCHVLLTIDNNGKVINCEGNDCKIGKKYATEEYLAPVRVFTGNVLITGCSRPLLSVRSNKPIAKAKISACGKFISGLRLNAPVKMGDVVVSNILNTGADLVATGECIN